MNISELSGMAINVGNVELNESQIIQVGEEGIASSELQIQFLELFLVLPRIRNGYGQQLRATQCIHHSGTVVAAGRVNETAEGKGRERMGSLLKTVNSI